jgi:prevent-host-death family protein
MKIAGQVKSVSTFKANAAEMIDDINETGNPVILTVNGEARVIVLDIERYQKIEDAQAMRQLLAIGDKAVREGRTLPAKEAMARVRERLKQKYP